MAGASPPWRLVVQALRCQEGECLRCHEVGLQRGEEGVTSSPAGHGKRRQTKAAEHQIEYPHTVTPNPRTSATTAAPAPPPAAPATRQGPARDQHGQRQPAVPAVREVERPLLMRERGNAATAERTRRPRRQASRARMSVCVVIAVPPGTGASACSRDWLSRHGRSSPPSPGAAGPRRSGRRASWRSGPGQVKPIIDAATMKSPKRGIR